MSDKKRRKEQKKKTVDCWRKGKLRKLPKVVRRSFGWFFAPCTLVERLSSCNITRPRERCDRLRQQLSRYEAHNTDGDDSPKSPPRLSFVAYCQRKDDIAIDKWNQFGGFGKAQTPFRIVVYIMTAVMRRPLDTSRSSPRELKFSSSSSR